MLPIFPLTTVLLPESEMELRIFEPRYKAMLKDCMTSEVPLGIVFCADHDDEVSSMRGVGCTAQVVKYTQNKDGSGHLHLRGIQRFLVGKVDASRIYYASEGRELNDIEDIDVGHPLLQTAQALVEVYRSLLQDVDPSMVLKSMPVKLKPTDSFKLFDQLLLPEEKRQTALELGSTRSRFALANKLLKVEIERLRFLLDDEETQLRVIN